MADKIAHRVCRHLVCQGWLEGEDESAFLSDRAGCDDGLDALRMSSTTYRIATGKHAGRKVATLQTIPADTDALEGDAGKVSGFSLHAGAAAEAYESQKLERLCNYIARPAISEKRLSLSPQGKVRYQLKTPWKNGTTHVAFEPVEFIAKLVALVPPPRAHLTWFHGVFAPNANLRAQLTPSGRGKRPPTGEASTGAKSDHRSPDEKRRSMTWAQRLKRVFNTDVSTCGHCGGAVRIVATRSGNEPAGPRSACCRGSVRNDHGRRGAAPPRCRNPTRERPIRAQNRPLRDHRPLAKLFEKGV